MPTTRAKSKLHAKQLPNSSASSSKDDVVKGGKAGSSGKKEKVHKKVPQGIPPGLVEHYKKIAFRKRGTTFEPITEEGKEESSNKGEEPKSLRGNPDGKSEVERNSNHLANGKTEASAHHGSPDDEGWTTVTNKKGLRRSPRKTQQVNYEESTEGNRKSVHGKPKKQSSVTPKSILKPPGTAKLNRDPKSVNPFASYAASPPSKQAIKPPKNAPIPKKNAWGVSFKKADENANIKTDAHGTAPPMTGNANKSSNKNNSKNTDINKNTTQTSATKGNTSNVGGAEKQNNQKLENEEKHDSGDTSGDKKSDIKSNQEKENPSNSSDKPRKESSATTQKTLPTKLIGNDRFVELTFQLENVSEEVTQADQVIHMREILKQVLHRGRNIAGDGKFGIQPIFEDLRTKWNLGTIVKTENITQLPYDHLRAYFSHTEQRKLSNRKYFFKNGWNTRWRIKFTVVGVDWRKFCHLHQLSKYDENIAGTYIPFKPSPTQGEYCYKLGFWMNSSDKQLVEDVEADLSEKYNEQITIKYDNMPGSYAMINKKWKEAKSQAGPNQDMRVQAQWSPQALCLFTTETNPTKRMQTVEKLIENASKQDKNEEYPKQAGGARMKFVPAHEYLATVDREKLDYLIMANIEIKKNAVDFVMPFNSNTLDMKVPSLGKTVGECILNLYDAKSQEMIFRHFTRGWNKTYEERPVRVSCMKSMSTTAGNVLQNLPDILGDIYGEEMKELLAPQSHQSEVVIPTLSIDITDRYFNGKAKCIIEGMEKLKQYEGEKNSTQKSKTVKKEAKDFGVTTYEDYSVSTMGTSQAEPKVAARGAITDLDSQNRDETSTFATEQTQGHANSEGSVPPEPTNVQADDVSAITTLSNQSTNNTSKNTAEKEEAPNQQEGENKGGEELPPTHSETEATQGSSNNTPQENPEAPPSPRTGAVSDDQEDPPSPREGTEADEQEDEDDEEFIKSLHDYLESDDRTLQAPSLAERRGEFHHEEYPWDQFTQGPNAVTPNRPETSTDKHSDDDSSVQVIENEEVASQSEEGVDDPFDTSFNTPPRPPRCNETDETSTYDDLDPAEFFDKWGLDIHKRIMRFNSRLNMRRKYRMREPVVGIDFSPHYFFAKDKFPVSVTEVENIIRYGFLGPFLTEEEEEMLFRLQTGLYDDAILKKAKDMDMIRRKDARKVPTRIWIPDEFDISITTDITYDVRSSVFRYYARAMFDALLDLFDQKRDAGTMCETYPEQESSSSESSEEEEQTTVEDSPQDHQNVSEETARAGGDPANQQ